MANRNLLDLVCYSLIASMGTLLIAIGWRACRTCCRALLCHAKYAHQRGPVSPRRHPPEEKDGRGTWCRFHNPCRSMRTLFPVRHCDGGHAAAGRLIGKFLILDAGRAVSHLASVWPAVLVTSHLLIIGFARTGMAVLEPSGGG